jgi:hydrogenase expression/formation protein HypD
MDNRTKDNIDAIAGLCAQLARGGGKVQIMEVCGTHTMAIARSGLRSLLPRELKLTSGPGCPVCVTDQSYMDRAIALARTPGVIVATYGDMVRVPGRAGSLAEARSDGCAVEIVVSADQAVELARSHPESQVVFLGVGFETTAPGTALAVLRAKQEDLKNFSVLTAHKLVLPALRALLSGGGVPVHGFLCPGHVSVILGWSAYEPIVRDFRVPCVVAGFDAAQVVLGVREILRQLRDDSPAACTVYPTVSREGNATAQRLLESVFEPGEAIWRAIGAIPGSGLVLRGEYACFEAANRFELPKVQSYEMPGCRCGEVITGRCSPADCGLFGRVCTPRDPVGPCMVSSEGACAAAYKYERLTR